uniref:Protein ORF61 n=1 Tax=Anguillid herpesvirus 1 TaxID=150286 RepID=A0A8E5ETW2_9VIRU|nr:protein ORF61 [Anguillid herpesvirus 1]QRM16747.1 protein ORF61 [Anguillid herpesvirus 1]
MPRWLYFTHPRDVQQHWLEPQPSTGEEMDVSPALLRVMGKGCRTTLDNTDPLQLKFDNILWLSMHAFYNMVWPMKRMRAMDRVVRNNLMARDIAFLCRALNVICTDIAKTCRQLKPITSFTEPLKYFITAVFEKQLYGGSEGKPFGVGNTHVPFPFAPGAPFINPDDVEDEVTERIIEVKRVPVLTMNAPNRYSDEPLTTLPQSRQTAEFRHVPTYRVISSSPSHHPMETSAADSEAVMSEREVEPGTPYEVMIDDDVYTVTDLLAPVSDWKTELVNVMLTTRTVSVTKKQLPDDHPLSHLFQCKVCLGTLSAPIWQCANGHYEFCPACMPMLTACPICRDRTFPANKVRNLGMMSVLEAVEPAFVSVTQTVVEQSITAQQMLESIARAGVYDPAPPPPRFAGQPYNAPAPSLVDHEAGIRVPGMLSNGAFYQDVLTVNVHTTVDGTVTSATVMVNGPELTPMTMSWESGGGAPRNI